jgi:hypothetical protein
MRAAVVILMLTLSLVAATPGSATTRTRSVAGAAPRSQAARARRMEAVVHAWSDRLNAGDNAGASRLFALPSIVAQGQYAFRFHTRAQLAQWHSGLPCSGEIVSIAIHGDFATAVFRLGDRGKTKCDAPGTLAAARFQIVNGKIVLWQQVPVPAKQAAPGTVA